MSLRISRLMRLWTILATILFTSPTFSQISGWTWARRAGGTYLETGLGISVDRFGNRFATGVFQGNSITFGSYTLNNTGWGDLFTVKYDSAGVVQWAKQSVAGSSSTEVSGGIINDYDGNTIVTGTFMGSYVNFSGTVLAGNGPSAFQSGFIVKYDPLGNVLWGKSIRGIGSYNDNINVASGADGSLYITGLLVSDSIYIGSTLYIPTTTDDIFIAKFDSSGNFIWATSAGGISSSEAFDITVDSLGNSYITGLFSGNSLNLGTTTLVGAGGDDAFIAKLDPSGNFVWAKSIGSSSEDVGKSIDVDASGYVHLFGEFSNTVTIGTTQLTAIGFYKDLFFAKYDPLGNLLWAQKVGGSANNDEAANDIAIGIDGNPVITGSFKSPQFIVGSTTLVNSNLSFPTNEVFIAKYNGSGNPIWAISAAGDHNDRATALALSGTDEYFITGSFFSTSITFGNITLVNAINNQVNDDFFIARYGIICNTVYSAMSDSGCNSYTSPSGNHVWTTSGIYNDTLITTLGCDSIITINLTINPIVPAQLTGGNQICQGDTIILSTTATYSNYLWSNGSTNNSVIITSPGTYSVTVTAANGCSDAASIAISYFPNTNISITAQGLISFCRGDSVMLSASPGLTGYQWYRYNNLIPGANTMNYIARSQGTYKCVGQNMPMCVNTSNIITINIPCVPVGPNQEKLEDEILEPLQLEVSQTLQDGTIIINSSQGDLSVYNLYGQLITQKYISEHQTEFVFNSSSGIYFFKLQNGSQQITRKAYIR